MAFARPILPLFRPVASLRPTQICRFSQCARLSRPAAVTTASTTAPVDANANVTGQSIRPLSPQAYFVRRTPSEFLPVYNEAKRGGNLKQTKLRKISGDIKRLANDLQAYLELSEKDIVVNRDTQSIVVKGHWKSKIEHFLESKGL